MARCVGKSAQRRREFALEGLLAQGTIQHDDNKVHQSWAILSSRLANRHVEGASQVLHMAVGKSFVPERLVAPWLTATPTFTGPEAGTYSTCFDASDFAHVTRPSKNSHVLQTGDGIGEDWKPGRRNDKGSCFSSQCGCFYK